jgi:two-component system response regulator RpaA
MPVFTWLHFRFTLTVGVAEEEMPTILIIEDVQELREMLANFVHRLGYEAVEAKDGLDGIKLAQAYKPSLIILDLMMPLASGDLTLGFIRSTEGLKEIPVLVASAHPKAREIAEQLGAEACLEKPFGFPELQEKIAQLLPVH